MSKTSDIKRAQDTEGVLRQTHIGGQALLEGVMMRGKYNWAVAVRTPSGEIHTESHDIKDTSNRPRCFNWPIIRGCYKLFESLLFGFKALDVATDTALDFEEDEEIAAKQAEQAEQPRSTKDAATICSASDIDLNAVSMGERVTNDVATITELNQEQLTEFAQKKSAEPIQAQSNENSNIKESSKDEDGKGEGRFTMVVGTILGIVLAVAIFVIAPAALSNLLVGDYDSSPVVWNIVDGLIRVAIFIAYICLISRISDIKRMFRYHGAEHKTIHCYEHGLELTPENAAKFPTLHVRCGTAFLVMTMILAIIVFSIVPIDQICIALGFTEGSLAKLLVVIASRIVLIPLIAGIGYELTVKWAGKHSDKALVKLVLWPGLQMQRLTTAEPDYSMLECAIEAMKIVLAREAKEEGAGEGITESFRSHQNSETILEPAIQNIKAKATNT